MYLVGGFTTANALTFAVTRMAIEPHLQDWVAEEIDAHHRKECGVDSKLRSCLS